MMSNFLLLYQTSKQFLIKYKILYLRQHRIRLVVGLYGVSVAIYHRPQVCILFRCVAIGTTMIMLIFVRFIQTFSRFLIGSKYYRFRQHWIRFIVVLDCVWVTFYHGPHKQSNNVSTLDFFGDFRLYFLVLTHSIFEFFLDVVYNKHSNQGCNKRHDNTLVHMIILASNQLTLTRQATNDTSAVAVFLVLIGNRQLSRIAPYESRFRWPATGPPS